MAEAEPIMTVLASFLPARLRALDGPLAAPADPAREPAFELSFDDLPRARWERMTEAAGCALQQTWAYGEAMRALGGEPLRVRVRDRSGADVALAQFILRRWLGRPRLALAARGPVWLTSPSEALRAEALAAIRAAPLRAAPGLGWPSLSILAPEAESDGDVLAADGMTRAFTGVTVAELDLTRSSDALRSMMRPKWRNRLVAAERAPLETTVARPSFDSYVWLLRADEAQQAQRGYTALPPIFTSLYQQLGGEVRLAVARRGERRLAAMLFLLHGRKASYHIGWSGEEGRRLGAHNLLLWRAMSALKREGVVALDLGGVDTGAGAGLARFKLGAGARAIRLPGSYL